MEYYVNSKSEEATIYEIYKACRLCGAGAGYKMPIIQNVVNLAHDEVELKLKVRECVQIEVHQDDKMPPLICELCVDKVNDFYEFLEMCRQTNMKTRLRLGLPPQRLSRGAPDEGDCILGLTEPVFINNDSNDNIKKNKISKNVRIKKEPESKLKSENQLRSRLRNNLKNQEETKSFIYKPSTLRSGRSKQPSPPPSPLRSRGTKRSSDDDISLNKLLKPRKTEMHQPKSILKRVTVEEPILQLRNKKLREPVGDANKKVKISPYVSTKLKKTESKIGARAAGPASPPAVRCATCEMDFRTIQALRSHTRSHAPKSNAAKAHPKPKICSRCSKSFTSASLMKIHKCAQKRCHTCGKCKRTFGNMGALGRHQNSCRTPPGASKVKIPPRLWSKLRPLQVRLSRCDSLLDETESCDANSVSHDFGLDTNCEYPYLLNRSLHTRIKSELSIYDSMVNIQDEIRDEFDLDRRYVYWDSDSEPDSDLELADHTNNVESLSTLVLRTVFSPKLLGKVPRKLRKIKSEKPFDSILNASEMDTDMRLGISDILESLNDQTFDKTDGNIDDDCFDHNNGPGVKNSDFDAIFSHRGNSASVNINGDSDKNESNVSEDILYSNVDISKDLFEKNNISENYCDNSIKDRKGSTLNDIDISHINNSASINSGASAHDISNIVIGNDKLLVDDLENIYETNSNVNVTESIGDQTSSGRETEKEMCNVQSRLEENNIAGETCIEKEKETIEFTKNIVEESRSVESIELSVTETEKHKSGSENENTNTVLDSDETNEKSTPHDINQVSDDTKKDIDHLNDTLDIINEKCDEETILRIDNTSEVEKVENKDVKGKCNDAAEKVNGNSAFPSNFNIDDLEDVSDTDMDDKKLMEALDAQIGDDESKHVDTTIGAGK